MRKKLILLSVILIIAFGCTNKEQAERIEKLELENEALRAIAGPPPSSLDAFFPPNTEQPVYMMRMFQMAMPLSGIMVDLVENDHQNVTVNFEKFKTQYTEVSKLIPEWEKYFPAQPVEELGEALKNGEQEKVMGAMEKVGNVCLDCHVANMVKVQQKYHWQDFHKIMVKDPLTNEEMNYIQFKQFLDSSFSGIAVDLEEGQMKNAQMQFQGFKARFSALSDSCGECHGTDERKYYVDSSVQSMIENLGKALESSPADPGAVQGILMGIGMESCGKCHLVHVPATLAKMQWGKKDKE